jgi:flagellar motor switch protein FliM
MSDADLITAMRRKAGVGRPPPDVTVMSTHKALKLAIAKAAEEGTGMVMQVTNVEEGLTSTSRLPEEISEHALLGLLEGPENSYGLAIFSLSVTTSVVEQLTTGSVLKMQPEERAPTSTDAMMCFGLMDQILDNFQQIILEAESPPDVAGYKTAGHLKETRSIPIAFDDIRYKIFKITVDMACGVRQGEIFMVYPAARPAPKRETGKASEWGQRFQTTVVETEACLEAILHRLSVPLAQVTEFEVGTILPIPQEALTQIEIIADGAQIARANLGQLDGHRALRVVLNDEDGTQGGSDGQMAFSGEAQFPDPRMETGAPAGDLDFPALGGMGSDDDFSDMPDTLPALGGGGMEIPSLGDLGAGFEGDGLPDLSAGLPDLNADLPADFPVMKGLPALE